MIINDGQMYMIDFFDYVFSLVIQMVFIKVFKDVGGQVLELLMKMIIMVFNEFQGNIFMLMNKCNVIINDMDIGSEDFIFICDCSLNVMFGFSLQFCVVIQGKGEFSMEFSYYVVVLFYLQ